MSVPTKPNQPCRNEFDRGIASSRDPTNAFLPDLDARTTTIYSTWFATTCPVCHHKFRVGDRVRLCPGADGRACGKAYHDDSQYGLHCWQERFGNGSVCTPPHKDRMTGRAVVGCAFVWDGTLPNESHVTDVARSRNVVVSRQFENGLKSVWGAFGGYQVRAATEEDAFVGHNCPWCRFKIRVGDHVVKCPCGECNTYFHNDIYRHLECWNEWNGTKGLFFCPTTGSRIPREKLVREQA
jgi:hypothetical protein